MDGFIRLVLYRLGRGDETISFDLLPPALSEIQSESDLLVDPAHLVQLSSNFSCFYFQTSSVIVLRNPRL
jgi:hypothetical protein